MSSEIVRRLRATGGKGQGGALKAEAANEIERLRSALEFISDGYDNHDVNHVDYRVKVYQVALAALLPTSQAGEEK